MRSAEPLEVAWACFDVGEVLVDETRVWATWAEVLGVPAFTVMGVLGHVAAAGGDHRRAFDLLGVEGWEDRAGAFEARLGGLQARDLYPDALPALAALRARGILVAVVGNQPASRHDELLAAGLDVDVLAMSDALGVAKPSPAFFEAVLELVGGPAGPVDPAAVVYVGDRVDNDVVPAAAAGLRTAWVRRGPWGLLQDDAGRADLEVRSLDELVDRLVPLAPGRGPR